jgi:hypothetical protein
MTAGRRLHSLISLEPGSDPGRRRAEGQGETADNAQTAALLARSGKGILAADESVPTMNARLAGAGVAGTAEQRRAYREILITTPTWAKG